MTSYYNTLLVRLIVNLFPTKHDWPIADTRFRLNKLCQVWAPILA